MQKNAFSSLHPNSFTNGITKLCFTAVLPQRNAGKTSLPPLAISVSLSVIAPQKRKGGREGGGVHPFQDEPGSEAGQSTKLKTFTKNCSSRISASTT